jgi:hypothetical protein
MTDRLQLILIPEPRDGAQPLPPAARHASIELVARMLLHLVRGQVPADDAKESGDESR